MPIRYATVLHPASSYTAMFYTLRMPSKQQQLVILRHNCARCSPAITENAAQIIRDEADILSADFNARLFDTIVGTAALTFYCTILPCFFVKVSCAILLFFICLSLRFLLIINVSSLHLEVLIMRIYLITVN